MLLKWKMKTLSHFKHRKGHWKLTSLNETKKITFYVLQVSEKVIGNQLGPALPPHVFFSFPDLSVSTALQLRRPQMHSSSMLSSSLRKILISWSFVDAKELFPLYLQEMDMNVVFSVRLQERKIMARNLLRELKDPNAVQWINLSFQKFTAKVRASVNCSMSACCNNQLLDIIRLYFTIPEEVEGRQNNQ